MSDDRRGLGRGLDDLMAQNEMDLPFLSAYGPASFRAFSGAQSPQEISYIRIVFVDALAKYIIHEAAMY